MKSTGIGLIMLFWLAATPFPAASADQVPTFPKHTPYSSARQTLLSQGWQPVRMPDATCDRGNRLCELPEAWYCEVTPSDATCGFTWKRGEIAIEVVAVGRGENPRVERVHCKAGCESVRRAQAFNDLGTQK